MVFWDFLFSGLYYLMDNRIKIIKFITDRAFFLFIMKRNFLRNTIFSFLSNKENFKVLTLKSKNSRKSENKQVIDIFSLIKLYCKNYFKNLQSP